MGWWAVQSVAGSRFSPYSSRFYQTVILSPWRRESDRAGLRWVESSKEETELNSAKVARNVSGGGWRERAHPCAFMACNIVKNDNSIKCCIYRAGSCHGTWPHVAPSDLYRKVKAIHVTYFISQSNFTGWPLSTQNKNKIAKAISNPKMHKSTRISLRDGGRERDRERIGLSCGSYEYVPQTIHFWK